MATALRRKALSTCRASRTASRPLAAHVADDHPDPVPGGDDLIQITADRGLACRGAVAGGDGDPCHLRRQRRKQRELRGLARPRSSWARRSSRLTAHARHHDRHRADGADHPHPGFQWVTFPVRCRAATRSAIASATAAPAKTAVRRSSAAVAAISGARLNSEITITPVATWSAPNTTSHKAATAIATCWADGRDRAVTLALPLARAASSRPPCFTEFSARFGTRGGDVTRRSEVRACGRQQRRRVIDTNSAL